MLTLLVVEPFLELYESRSSLRLKSETRVTTVLIAGSRQGVGNGDFISCFYERLKRATATANRARRNRCQKDLLLQLCTAEHILVNVTDTVGTLVRGNSYNILIHPPIQLGPKYLRFTSDEAHRKAHNEYPKEVPTGARSI